jgi:hypothetical protein
VRSLARRRARRVLRRGALCVGRRRHGGAAVGQHHEVAPEAVAEHELRIGLQRRLRMLGQIGVVAGEGLQGALEGVAGGGDGGADR